MQLSLVLCAGLALATALAWGRSWQRQVTAWWRLLPVVFVAGWLQPWGVWALVLGIGLLAVRDLAPHAGDRPQATRLRLVLLALALLLALAQAVAPGWTVIAAAAMAAAAGWAYRRWRAKPALLLALFALQAAGLWCLPLLAMWPTRPETEAGWFFYVCTVTALNDVAQFVSGKCLGRHALAPRISPNKTWQGVLGGVLGSLMVSVGVGRALDLAGVPTLLVLGGLLSLSGLLGDLLYSAGKRTLGIKDYSDLIPGHGGILDRVDSLVLTAPTLLLVLLVI